jgi:hypothetical protein
MGMKSKSTANRRQFRIGSYSASFVKLADLSYWEIYGPKKKIVGFAASKEDVIEKVKQFELEKSVSNEKESHSPSGRRNYR